MFLGRHPVARVNAHPPIFAAELQAPMGTYLEEYGTCNPGNEAVSRNLNTSHPKAPDCHTSFTPYVVCYCTHAKQHDQHARY